ncbi:MAG: hypothetical protein ACOYT4_04090 [Nanoarchaeota archaeon]
MAKILNVMFGIGIAVVIYILVLLGIQAFYPAVRYEDFCNQSIYSDPILNVAKCQDNMTVGECRASMKLDDDEMQKCQQEFTNANRNYNKNFFIIASILGVTIMIIAFFLLTMPSISAGISGSGIVLIIWAFTRGWESANDKLKFFVGLIIAIIVITLALILNNKLEQKKKS